MFLKNANPVLPIEYPENHGTEQHFFTGLDMPLEYTYESSVYIILGQVNTEVTVGKQMWNCLKIEHSSAKKLILLQNNGRPN